MTGPEVEKFRTVLVESCKGLSSFQLQDNPHIVYKIFGIEQLETKQVVVVDAFTSSGKTYDLVNWLAKNINSKTEMPYKIIVAFREVGLACQAAVDFYDACRKLGDKHYGNVMNHGKVQFQFRVTDEHIAEYTELAEKNADFSPCLNFMRRTTATTDLRDGRAETLHRAKLVFTTHESALTLAKIGVTEAREVFFDEAPVKYLDMVEIIGTAEAHMDLYARLAATKDHNLTDSRRLATLVETGVFKFYPTICGILEPATPVLFNADDNKSDSGLGCLDGGANESCSDSTQFIPTSENDLTPKPETKKYLPVVVDFQSFKAKSITVMTAFAKGTEIRIIEKLTGDSFIYTDTKQSAPIRDAVRSRTAFVLTNPTCSCSKAARDSKEAKAAKKIVGELIALLGAENVLGVAHSWGSDVFKKYKAMCVKLNATGTNLFKDKEIVIVMNLKFFTPAERAMWKSVFVDEFEEFEQEYLVNCLMQSIMRSNLRDRGSLADVLVISPDERVMDLLKRGLKGGVRRLPFDKLMEVIERSCK